MNIRHYLVRLDEAIDGGFGIIGPRGSILIRNSNLETLAAGWVRHYHHMGSMNYGEPPGAYGICSRDEIRTFSYKVDRLTGKRK